MIHHTNPIAPNSHATHQSGAISQPENPNRSRGNTISSAVRSIVPPAVGRTFNIRSQISNLRDRRQEALLRQHEERQEALVYANTTHLTTAIRNNDSDEFHRLLNDGHCNINGNSDSTLKPLTSAIAYSNPDMVQTLLSMPTIDVNQLSLASTPLSQAMRMGQETIIDALLAHPDIDVNCRNQDGKTPLLAATDHYLSFRLPIYFRNIEKLLSAPNIDPNAADTFGQTPLTRAARAGKLNLVTALLENDATDVNKPNSLGLTPLMIAASEGHTDVMKALLQHPKIALEKTDHREQTALLRAAEWGKPASVALLLNHGANLHHRTTHGITAHSLATQRGSGMHHDLQATSVAYTETMFALLRADPSVLKPQ